MAWKSCKCNKQYQRARPTSEQLAFRADTAVVTALMVATSLGRTVVCEHVLRYEAILLDSSSWNAGR